MNWFEVDKQGLARLLERRGKEFVVFELVQNAWDEDTRRVEVSLRRDHGTRFVKLEVKDDNPDGFKDLRHSFTLFADSAKKADPTKAGRFNLGEKLVLAACESASVVSTSGGVEFWPGGRRSLRSRTERGTVFTGRMKMTDTELQQVLAACETLLPRPGITTVINGKELPPRKPVHSFETTLPTEIADAEGNLRRTARKTRVDLYEVRPGEEACLFELGIPVVATGDRWHVDISQKVPLNFDRDNVTPAYLSQIRAEVLAAMAARIDGEDANATWVKDALQTHGDKLPVDAISRVMDLRFGEKRVAYDPSDVEASHRAVAEGYNLVYGASLSGKEWEAARRAGAILPAGRVTPTPRPFSPDGKPLRLIERAQYEEDHSFVADYSREIGRRLLGCEVTVSLTADAGWKFIGAYSPGSLVLNMAKLGRARDGIDADYIERLDGVLLHEFAHHLCDDHLDAEFHRAIERLGAKLKRLAIEEPGLFAAPTMSKGKRAAP